MADLKDVKAEKSATTTSSKVHLPDAKGIGFRAVANRKSYEDRTDKSKSTMRMAWVPVRFGALTVEASIYLETKIEQRADGRYEDSALRFSMPKNTDISADVVAGGQSAIDTWKNTVLDAYEAWAGDTGENLRSAAVTPGVRRLGSKKAVDPTSAKA